MKTNVKSTLMIHYILADKPELLCGEVRKCPFDEIYAIPATEEMVTLILLTKHEGGSLRLRECIRVRGHFWWWSCYSAKEVAEWSSIF